MRLLLDTQLVLWWEAASARLPAELPSLLANAAEVYFSRASLWEMAIKISIGKLRVNIAKLSDNIEKHGFRWLDIRNDHLFAVADLPLFPDHRDPFDRLLVSQSRVEPLILVTADDQLARYGETVLVVSAR